MCGGCCEEEDVRTSSPSPRGPPKRKSVCCTDIPTLIIFILFLGGMGYVAFFAFVEGDVHRLVKGFDSYGNVCGRDNTDNPVNGSIYSGRNMTDRKYVFFMDIKYPKSSLEICVSECPTVRLNNSNQLENYAKEKGVSFCDYGIKLDSISSQKTCSGKTACPGPCPALPVYKSEPVINRCFPSAILSETIERLQSLVLFFNQVDFLQRLAFDITVAWKKMVALGILALIASLLMVLLIRFLAAVIVYVIIVLSSIALAVTTGVLWWMWVTHETPIEEANLVPFLEIAYDTKTAFLIYAIISSVVTFILIVVFIALRNSITLCVELFQEAGQLLGHCPLLLIQPLWTFLVLIIFLTYWITVACFLGTAGKPVFNNTTNFVEFQDGVVLKILWAYHAVGLIWVSQFILACQELVIGSVVATFYFAKDKSTVSYPITNGIGITIKHHLGSIALGSLIITLVKIPRYIILWVQHQMKGKEDECTKCCLRTCSCCLWCLEKCLKFLNRNAYVTIAITGKSFCAAAREAFATIVLNAGRVAAINSIGDFVLFLGKMGVVGITATAGVFWFKADPATEYFFLPVLLTSIFSYFIAHCFLSIYEMTVDALLLCFCEAEKRKEFELELNRSMTKLMKQRSSEYAEEIPLAGKV